MNCLNGFFHDLYTTSLAESLLKAPHGRRRGGLGIVDAGGVRARNPRSIRSS